MENRTDDRIYVEIKPFEPADSDGYAQGVIHADRLCDSMKSHIDTDNLKETVAVYPVFPNNRDHYSIKVGRGAWIKVKKENNQCPDCFG